MGWCEFGGFTPVAMRSFGRARIAIFAYFREKALRDQNGRRHIASHIHTIIMRDLLPSG